MRKIKRLICVLLTGFVFAALPISQAVAKESKKDKSGKEVTIPGLDKKSPAETEVPTTPETTETTPSGPLSDKVLENIERGAKNIRETLNKDSSLRDTVNITASYVNDIQDQNGAVVGYGLLYVVMWTSPFELIAQTENASPKELAEQKKISQKIDGVLVKLFKLSTDKLLSKRPEFVNITVQIDVPSGGLYKIVADAEALRQLPKKASTKTVLSTVVSADPLFILSQEEYITFLNLQQFLELFGSTYPNEFQVILAKFNELQAAQQQQGG